MSRAPEAQPKPFFYDDNKRHGFQLPDHTLSTQAMTWLLSGTDVVDKVMLTWPML